jgi:hypothetical protein
METNLPAGETKLKIQLLQALNEDDKDFAMGDTNQDLVNDLYESSGFVKTPGSRPKKKKLNKN